MLHPDGHCMLYAVGAQKLGSITLHWAGTSCLDDSRMGLRAGCTGPEAGAFLIWAYERRKQQEHIVIQECTEEFDPQRLTAVMGDLYE
eukprot:3693559-Alexandrium_andersonii.AAC.1